MKQADITITTYECEEYLVDIVTTSDTYEAWIYRKELWVKTLMFGVSKEQQPLDLFLDIVAVNVEEYGADYDEEYAV